MKNSKVQPLLQPDSKYEKFFMNLINKKDKIIKSFIALFILVFAIGFGYTKVNNSKRKDILSAAQLVKDLQQQHSLENLEKFGNIVSKNKKLQYFWDGFLAQSYISAGKNLNAKRILSRINGRKDPFLIQYKLFNEITFLIEDQKYELALEKTEGLETILSKKDIDQTLGTLNLLRKSRLQEILGLDSKRKESVKQFAALNNSQELRLGALSLGEFIRSNQD